MQWWQDFLSAMGGDGPVTVVIAAVIVVIIQEIHLMYLRKKLYEARDCRRKYLAVLEEIESQESVRDRPRLRLATDDEDAVYRNRLDARLNELTEALKKL